MSFQQALSGLNASSSALDAIGNNIANASTIGFKQASAQFADAYAAALGGASGGVQAGMGTTVSSIAQQFSQGSITADNNPLDVAINGGGFFLMQQPTSTAASASSTPAGNNFTYTRAGQFQLDQNGYIVNSSGAQLQGYTVSNGQTSGQLSSIKITPGNSKPVLTSNVGVNLNLDSRSATIATAPTLPATYVFNPTDPTTFTSSTSATVYDSQGKNHTLGIYFVHANTSANTWLMYTNIDGGSITNAAATTYNTANPPPATQEVASLSDPVTLTFDTSGNLNSQTVTSPTLAGITGSGHAADNTTSLLTGTSASINQGFGLGGGVANLTFKLSLGSSTQFGNNFAVNTLSQDGSASSQFVGLNILPDGTVQSKFGNGQTQNVAIIALATFANPNGLTPLGNNQWGENDSTINGSGTANKGYPGAGGNGILQPSATEGSNVDLTAQLVDMITQQRNYQANAQTIKTMDTIMQTLINLR